LIERRSLKGLEGQDRVGALDSGHGVYVFRYEPSDIDIVFDIELGQEIELAAHRIDLRCDLAIGDFVGHGIGLAEFALEFHEKTLHRRCSPVLALFWCPGPFVPVKVGMITTLSGGGAGLGIDVRDGFMLALQAIGQRATSR
jgi:hypothetical protein